MSRSRKYREGEPEARHEPSSSHHYGGNVYGNPFTPPWPYSSAAPSHMPYYPDPYWHRMQQFPSAMLHYPPPAPMYPAAIPQQHGDPTISGPVPPSTHHHRSAPMYEDRARSSSIHREERYGNDVTSARRSPPRRHIVLDSADTYDYPAKPRQGREEILIRRVDSDQESEGSSTDSMNSQGASAHDGQGHSQDGPPDTLYTVNVFGYSRGQRETQVPLTITRNQPIEFKMKRPTDRKIPSRDKRQSKLEQPIFHVAKFLASSRHCRSLKRFGFPSRPMEMLMEGANAGIEADAGTIVTIRSEHVIKAIDRLIGTFPGMIHSGDSLIVPEPFCALLHHRELLLGQAEQIDAQSAVPGTQKDGDGSQVNIDPEKQPHAEIEGIHLRKLYDYLDQDYLEPVQREKTRWKERRTCTFEWLWLLFPPKTLVYEGRSDVSTMRAFQVRTFFIKGLFASEGGKPTLNPARLDPMENGESPIEDISISIDYLRHDGRGWISCRENVVIQPFTGEKPITELPVFPASFLNDQGGALRQALIDRGKRYQNLGNRGQVDYHGDCLSGVRRRLDGKVVVDPETYHYEPHLIKQVLHSSKKKASGRNEYGDDGFREERDWGMGGSKSGVIVERSRPRLMGIVPGKRLPSTDSRYASGGWDPVPEAEVESEKETIELSRPGKGTQRLDDLEEEEYMICTPNIMGYILKEREWVKLAVGSISDCVYEERMIDDLQITQEARNLVQALSHNFAVPPKSSQQQVNGEVHTHRPWSADFVPGKGGGRIILLHGKPGVGKTSTAECVAELTKRPLLTITCGDLGTNAMSVDQELTRWLRLGTLWNAVLLFDEADVFLEARAHGDIDRNSLVSVFLRALEYYQGLMFLTTNRIGSFDEAIISRIHVVLHLPDLTDMDRERIWNTSFRKLEKERTDIGVDYQLVNYAYHDDEIRELNWNGREIRNAFNTMIALAEWDAQQHGRYTKDGKVEVRREHLQGVARMSSAFKLYLKSLRAMEHEEYTKSLGLRDDRFRLAASR